MTLPRDPQKPEDSSADRPLAEEEAGHNQPTVGDQTLVEPDPKQVDPQANTHHGDSAHDPLQHGPTKEVHTVADFVESVSLSGLMTREELEQYQEGLSSGDDPQSFADQLVQKQKLTTYQANALRRGHVRGLLIGNYEVLDRIGHGGMGVVYRARHRRMQREVALKILPSAVSGKTEGVERFAREVQAAARLQHPNIAAAFDADLQGGMHYLAMELIDGPNLSGYVKEAGPLPLAVAVQLMCQAARGLAYAHSQGVVHRDIKPGNLLVNRNGVLKVLDMGLAQFSRRPDDPDQAELTQSGRIMGTVDYMAPEQAVDAKSVDNRADIYSVGCTLYYLLAGEPMSPPGPLTKKLLWHQNSPAPSLRGIRPEVPEQLDQIYLKMVAKTPGERQQSMEEVAEALETVLGELSYSDLNLPMVGITLSENPGSVGGSSSHPSTSSPIVLGGSESGSSASHESSPQEETVVVPAKSKVRYSKAPLAAVIGVAVALIAMFVAFANWRPTDRPQPSVADNGSGTPGEPPEGPQPGGESPTVTPPVAPDAGPDHNAPATLILQLPAGASVYLDDQPIKSFRTDPKLGRFYSVGAGEHEVRVVSAAGADYRQQISPAAGEVVKLRPQFDVSPGTELLAHKQLINWVFDQGGTIEVMLDGAQRTRRFKQVSPELLKPFQLTGIDLTGLQLTGDDLQRLNSASTDLQQLSLAKTNVSDDALEHLQPLKELKSLDLSGTAITSAAISSLNQLSELQILNLAQTDLGNAAAAQLSAMRNLRELDLRGTKVSDLGLEQLGSLKQLTDLAVHDTVVTSDGYDALQTLLPKLEIHWAGPDLDRAIAQQVQQAGGEVVYRLEKGEDTPQTLSSTGLLPLARISVLEIDLGKSQALDDEFFNKLPVLEHLTTIHLGAGDFTLRDLAGLRGSNSLTTLDIGDLQLAEGTEALKKELAPIEIKFRPPADVTVAQWVVGQGGNIELIKQGQAQQVSTTEALPEYPYQLTGIRLEGEVQGWEEQLPDFARLASLQMLSLANTTLTPAQLLQVIGTKSLRELDLSGTQVNAEVLAAVAKLPELITLRLNNVQLTATELASLTKLNQLEELTLSNVSVDAQSLAAFTPPQNLKRLDLSNTSLNDSAIANLTKNKQLESLDVKGTSLTDVGREQLASLLGKSKVDHDPLDPARLTARWVLEIGGEVVVNGQTISSLKKLPREAGTVTSIDLSELPPTASFKLGEIAEHLKQCSELERVVLQGLAFGDDVPQALLSSPNLQDLDLSNTTLRDSGLQALAPLEKLKRLDISHSRVSRASMATLKQWPELEQLGLAGLSLADNDLAVLAQLKQLSVLNLGSRSIGNGAVQHLVDLPLTELSLQDSAVGNTGVRMLGGIKTLQTLDLTRTNVTDESLSALTSLPLIDLQLIGTEITNSGLNTLGQVKSLQRLDVSQTKATKEGVAQLRKALPQCHIPPTSLRSEEDRDQVQNSGGGLFGN